MNMYRFTIQFWVFASNLGFWTFDDGERHIAQAYENKIEELPRG